MSTAVAGGCACGAVRYRSAAAPVVSLHCHCRQCQRITGAGHASQLALRADAVAVEGTLSEFALVADSGNAVTSAFCPRCGSPVLKRSAGFPDLVFLHAATLDEPAAFRAQRSVWTRSRQPWDCLDPSVPA
ncbi:MAG: GFA family protein, partial [Alphaproteobacteria bacterium]|nr:GFA family protein [Alphaproteobacteria bacterium]